MINASDIASIEMNRKRNKKELYKKIHEQFCRKIRHTVELGGKCVLLRVPAVVFGFPIYDRSQACTYLKRQLELGGFNVQVLTSIDLCITWGLPKRENKIHTTTVSDDTDLPSFINLKKMANKYRSGGA